VVFVNCMITGESPSILSTSGRSRPPKIVWHKQKGFYVSTLSFGINSINARDDFPEPERPVITTSFHGELKHLFF
jgi:hypothetical protein